MKIAIDCRMIGSGGIGSYISTLLPFFIRENKCLLIGTENQLKNFEKNSNTEIYLCDEKCFSLKEIFNFNIKILSKINSCDLYYSPYCNIPGGIKVPVFSTIHDVVFLDVEGLSSKTGTFIRKQFYKRACSRSKVIFTVSNFSADRIKAHIKTKTPVVCTYNAVPEWFYQSQNSKAEKEDKILFVGNIKKHKGLHTLLDAFIMAKNKGLSSKLVIVGNKDNFRTKDDSIFQKIDSAPDGQVIFTGKISDDELRNLYQTSKLLVQPSFYEGFGMPPMEALSLGTNVIMSDIEVFKEIYKELPVTFFKTGDSNDLCNKLLNYTETDLSDIDISKQYSFEKTYKIIKETLEHYGDK